jgi:hypothetical protein
MHTQETSAKARREFQGWLEGFKPEPFAGPHDDVGSALHDRVWTTSALWALAAVLLSVWTLGLLTSVTLDGGIHLAFGGAMVLMVAAWLRRTRHPKPMTIKSRSRWDRGVR